MGILERPSFITPTIPNLFHLSYEAVGALIRAVSELRRRKVVPGEYPWAKGGVRAIEATFNEWMGTWNLHSHLLADVPYIALYPMTDIEWRGGKVVAVRTHPGLRRVWTQVCQNYPELPKGVCAAPGRHTDAYDPDCPDCWYQVDIREVDREADRKADRNALDEVCKYITKQSSVLGKPRQDGESSDESVMWAKARRLVEFTEAMKGHRLIDVFGSLRGNVKIDSTTLEFEIGDQLVDVMGEEDEKKLEESNWCPWEDCPDRQLDLWYWAGYGWPEGRARPIRNRRTGTYRVVTETAADRAPPATLVEAVVAPSGGDRRVGTDVFDVPMSRTTAYYETRAQRWAGSALQPRDGLSGV